MGGLYAHKGWPLLEAAVAEAPPGAFTLMVVDHVLTGNETREARLGATPVVFRGKVAANRMAEAYAGIDVLLAPSIWPEAHGLAVREALRCGCWVVASDRGAGADDIVPGRNGFVIDVAGPDGLRAALATNAGDAGRFRCPPPPTRLRTAREQADELACLYDTVLSGLP